MAYWWQKNLDGGRIFLDFTGYPFEVLYDCVRDFSTIPYVFSCNNKVLAYSQVTDPNYYTVQFRVVGSQIQAIRDKDYHSFIVDYIPWDIYWTGKMAKLDFDWWNYFIRKVDNQKDWNIIPAFQVDINNFEVNHRFKGRKTVSRTRLPLTSQNLYFNDLPIIDTNLPFVQDLLERQSYREQMRMLRQKTAFKKKVALTVDQIESGLNRLVKERSGKCTFTRVKIQPKLRRWVYHALCTEKWSSPAGWYQYIKLVPQDARFTNPRKMAVFARCTCPSWVFHGPEYFGLRQDYLDGKPRGWATTPNFSKYPWKKSWKLCKHVEGIMKIIKGMPELPAERVRQKRYPEVPPEKKKQKKPVAPPVAPAAPPEAEAPPVEAPQPEVAPKTPRTPIFTEPTPEPEATPMPAGPAPEMAPEELAEGGEGETPGEKPGVPGVGLQPGLRPGLKPKTPETMGLGEEPEALVKDDVQQQKRVQKEDIKDMAQDLEDNAEEEMAEKEEKI